MYTLPRPVVAALVLVALLAGVAPLFVGIHLPAVDAPQHLFLIHVLRSLDDATSPYREIFVAPAKATYLSLYLGVKWLSVPFGLERALELFSAVSVLSIVAGVAVLAKAFGRPAWTGLFAIPFAFTDNFYWGLFSFHASIGPSLLACGLFVLVLEETDDRRANRLAIGLALALLAVQVTHAAAMVLPGLALPLLLVTTRFDRRRVTRALLALVPGVTLFGYWLLSSVHRDRALGKPGDHWKAAAPLFDVSAWKFNAVGGRIQGWWELLANGFWGWADRWPVQLSAAAILLVAIVGFASWRRRESRPTASPTAWATWIRTPFDPRPVLLLLLVVGLYLALPTDIPGYMYQLHFRYAQVVALVALPVLVRGAPELARLGLPVAVLLAVASGGNLAYQFRRFDREAGEFEQVASQLRPGARIQHLVVKTGSRVATHAVYVHYPALAALRANGVPSFSLAIDPSFPVNYAPDGRPPGSPWEWRPLEFTWDDVARHYDHFLARGAPPPARLFGTHASEVESVAAAGDWVLYRRRGIVGEPVNKPD